MALPGGQPLPSPVPVPSPVRRTGRDSLGHEYDYRPSPSIGNGFPIGGHAPTGHSSGHASITLPPSSFPAATTAGPGSSSIIRPDPASMSATPALAPAPPPPPTPLTLEQLMTIYLSAKRSLGATGLVARANTLARQARQALEDHVAAGARNGFLQVGITVQLASLDAVWTGLDRVVSEYKADFLTSTLELEKAKSQIGAIVEQLGRTPVDRYFRPPNEGPKTVADFVDQQQVELVKQDAADIVTRFEDAHTNLADTIDQFYGHVQAARTVYDGIAAMLEQPISIPGGGVGGVSGGNKLVSGKLVVPTMFRNIEARATECGQNLLSLVDHFDRCTTVLMHTDGGGEAILRMGRTDESAAAAAAAAAAVAAAAAATAAGVLSTPATESAPNSDTPDPAEDGHIAAMAAIVQTDALEVDDVVAEIADGVEDMEEDQVQLSEYLSELHHRSTALEHVLQQIQGLASEAHGHAVAADTFRQQWLHDRAGMADRLTELSDLADYRAGLVEVYDRLLMEAERRDGIERASRAYLLSMLRRIDGLADEDDGERAVFRERFAPWLEVAEEMWARLPERAVKWRLVPVFAGEGEGEGVGAGEGEGEGGADGVEIGVQESRDRERDGEGEEQIDDDEAGRVGSDDSHAVKVSAKRMERVYRFRPVPKEVVDGAVARVRARRERTRRQRAAR